MSTRTPKEKRKNAMRCFLSCCVGNRSLSDEDDFDDVRAIDQNERVVEAEDVESPHISTGTIPEELVGDAVQDSITTEPASQKEELRQGAVCGDAEALNAHEETAGTPNKTVHFAMCHEHEGPKDTRESYRNTPVKERSPPVAKDAYTEEHFFIKNKNKDGYAKIPLSAFKLYVADYVRKIVASAVEAIEAEDAQAAEAAAPEVKEMPLSSDDENQIDEAEEDRLVSDLVDYMLTQVVLSMAAEKMEQTQQPSESFSSDSNTNFSTDTRVSSSTSLEWDGYEPLLLREDPSATDISIRCPEIAAGAKI